ncbi:MAG: hypothetical protein H0W72_11970 [Planctomycetes bacterium]|nr:hypothetical protein [Planctomycetota bacterium]
MTPLTWPLKGVGLYLNRPQLWGWPLLAMLGALIVIGGTFASILVWQWPLSHEVVGWWRWLLGVVGAFGKAGGLALALWLIGLPVLLGAACEQVAKRIQDDAGAPPAEAGLALSMAATLRVVLNTLHVRLAWMAVAIIAMFVTGPFGLLVGALAVAHVACIDAVDVALAMRGFSGAERLQLMDRHRPWLRQGALSAAALSVALGATVVGWLFFLPGLVAGASLMVLDWPEVRQRMIPPDGAKLAVPVAGIPSAAKAITPADDPVG